MAGHEVAATLAWNENLSTGVDALDAQHKALFDCMSLLEAATQEKSLIRTCYFLEQLSNYVNCHFSEEEYQMRIHDYPGLVDHVWEHRDFSNRLYHVRSAYLDRDITGDLVALLRDWLVQHVARSDMDYVPYLTPERRLLPVTPEDFAMAEESAAQP